MVHAEKAYSTTMPVVAQPGSRMPQMGSSWMDSFPSMTTNDCARLKKLSPGTHPTMQLRQSLKQSQIPDDH
jgi:hypothetical protein